MPDPPLQNCLIFIVDVFVSFTHPVILVYGPPDTISGLYPATLMSSPIAIYSAVESELFPVPHPSAADIIYVPAGSCLLTTVVIVLTDIAFAGAVVVVKLPILVVLVLMDLHQFATSRRHCNMLSMAAPPRGYLP